MKPLFAFLVAVMLISVHSAYAATDLAELSYPGKDPGKLNYYIHLPAGEHVNGKWPLLVALHGCNQSAKSLARISGWNELADREGFAVLYPEQRFGNNPSHCFNWFDPDEYGKDKGEVLSISTMIRHVCDSFSLDTSRICIYGVSAGAALSVALLADYPDRFRCGAIVAGGPFGVASNAADGMGAMISPKNTPAAILADLVRQQNPSYSGSYPPLVLMHGRSDIVVDIMNSYKLIKQWSVLEHTDTVPTVQLNDFSGHKGVTRYEYRDSGLRTHIVFYEIEGLGHNLAVDPGDGPTEGGQTGIFATDRGFFSSYWLGVEMGLVAPADPLNSSCKFICK